MARKGRNIYRRKDGRWEGRIRNTSGEKGGYRSFYGNSYKEVKDKMEQFVFREKEVEQCTRDCMTVREALAFWEEGNQKRWKPSTHSYYAGQIHRVIIPELGEYCCKDLNNQIFYEFVQRQKELSDSGLKRICGILGQSLQYVNAIYGYDFLIPKVRLLVPDSSKNARAAETKLPPATDVEKLEKYLLEHLDDSTCLGILLAMYTGIRIGELCALRWEDINLEKGFLTIRGTLQRIGSLDVSSTRKAGEDSAKKGKTEVLLTCPKSASSLREIPIPSVILHWLCCYGSGKRGYMVKGKHKDFAEPRTVQYRFESILRRCGLEPFNFHCLRHVFASRCLQQGFDCKTLSEILGHSSVQITLGVYVHSGEERKRQLMDRLTIHEVM